MKRRLLHFLAACVVLFSYRAAVCQLREQSLVNRDQISIPSPNVASLGLFKEVPVSTFTGLPQIEIPLYTFTEGKISIPITLSYHASGFRPDVHPGWVGMGWSLNASGWAITRKVNGKADDYDTYDNEVAAGYPNPVDPYSSRCGYYYNRTALSATQWNQVSYMNTLTDPNGSLLIVGSRKDTEPDEFSFSFPNGGGKFYMDMDGSWKVDCDRAVKVTFDNTFIPVPFTTIQGSLLQNFGYYKTFSGFTITDTDGTKYVYGGTADFIEYSIDFVEQDTDFWTADSWFLKEIVEPSGRKISFTYKRAEFINQMVMSLSQNFGTGSDTQGFWVEPCGPTAGSLRGDFTGRLIFPLYLDEISGKLGTVKFKKSISNELKFGVDYGNNYGRYEQDIYGLVFTRFHNPPRVYDKIFPILKKYFDDLDTEQTPPTENFRSLTYMYFYASQMKWYRLDAIEVNSNNTQRVKTLSFAYQSGLDRLALKSVTETSGNLSLQPFSFEYYPIDQVPYFSGMTDHWGFYNGVFSPDNFVNLDTDPTIYFNSRSADSTYAKQGVLKKITYPTGGYTAFLYEGNFADKVVPTDRSLDPVAYTKQVGGLRIRRITDINSTNPLQNQVREYFYVKGYKNSLNVSTLTRSGILGGQSQYLFKDFRVPHSGGGYYKKNQFNSMSQLPASNNSQGSHIGYSEVVEKRADNSFTIFHYQNFDNGHKDESSPTLNLMFSPYGPYTSLERQRGKIWRMVKYNASDIPVYQQDITYQAIDKSTQFAKAIRTRLYTVCPQTNDRYKEGTAYKNYTYPYLPLTITETTYDVNGANGMSTSKTFAYNSYQLQTSETFLNSDQKSHLYKNYYCVDFTGTQPFDDMKAANILEPVIKREFLLDNVLKEVTQTDYSKTLSPNTALILPSAITTKHLADAAEVRLRFYKYDDRGNLLSYSKENGTTINYLWGHNKNYPVAEIRNAPYSVITDVLGAANIDTYGNATDTYGMVPLTNQSLKTFMAPLRTDPRLKDALVTTYLYTPLLGMVSKTDANNSSTYFVFDSFTRLIYVKDNDNNILKKYEYNLQLRQP